MTIASNSPVVVIGMHRSGTTMLAQALERGGVCMGNDHTAYAESNFFQRHNIALMQRHNADWDEPVATTVTPEMNPRQLLTEYAAFPRRPLGWWPLLKRRGWGWKDPRNTYTLGSWLAVFPELCAVHIYRNGLDVARSLHVRNAMLQPESKWHSPLLNDLKACFDLWERYTVQAREWKRVLGNRYTAVRYEDLAALNAECIEQLETCVGKKLKPAFKFVVDKERARREPMEDGLEALRVYARGNQTLLRLGYAID